jgi:O-antigen/teichoic acid export membrane protein
MSLYSGLSLLVVFIPIIIKTIPFIFGELYSQSTIVLLLLLPTNILLLLIRFIYSHLMATNSHEKAYWAYASAFMVMVIADVLLIPLFGVIGAAISMNIAYLTCLFILVFQYKNDNGVNWRDFLIWNSVDSQLIKKSLRKIYVLMTTWLKTKFNNL